MTWLLLGLAALQAGLLFWSAINLGNAVMQTPRLLPLLRTLLTLAPPLALAWFAPGFDPLQRLCPFGDCLILMAAVTGVRVWAVTREGESFAAERAIARRRAAEAAAEARRREHEAKIRAAAAEMEARLAAEAAAGPAATPAPTQPRHLTAPILRGGVRSPRFPAKPKE